ncbi:hypothetical protein [Tenacibaculum sp.]|uniref:hypothetical protein n=1 Tax=Tenacibaculum sp. TaxID=1906242 RepID=UPI003AA98F04
MNKLKNTLEKQNQIWVFLIGIALIIAGFYFFFHIQELEEAGQEVRFSRKIQWVYDYLGKYGMFASFEIVGLIALISGIKQLKGKL